jgi:acyl dehydratase
MSTTTPADHEARLPEGTLTSEWLLITQSMIDAFASVTLDPDPMHIDPVWAKERGPFGRTIAFGFLTISLMTHLVHNAQEKMASGQVRPLGTFLNYGFDRLRLIAPVPSGGRIRGHFNFGNVTGKTKAGYDMYSVSASVEIEGHDVPALVAQWLSVCVPPGERRNLGGTTTHKLAS